MNEVRFLQKIGGSLLMLLLLAACSQDENLTTGTLLPEGKYPLELTAGGLEVVATPVEASTRATYNGTWNGGEKVYVQIASSKDYTDENSIPWQSIDPIQYTVAQDGEMTLVDAGNQRYWQSTDEKFYVRAWYPGTRTDYEDIPWYGGSWAVHENQSSKDALAQDDFLYAYKVLEYNPSSANSLEFRHLLSKLVFNLKSSDYLKGFSKDEISVILMTKTDRTKWNISGIFKDGQYDQQQKDFALDSNVVGTSNGITPYRLDSPNNISSNEVAYLSYEALCIPQPISHFEKNIVIKVGESTYIWEIQLDGYDLLYSGYKYTFNITVDAKKLNVTVDSNNINWGNTGNTGQGSVEIQ